MALYHRRITGEGQHIELAESYAVTSLLGEAFMEYFMNGYVMGPQGNYHPTLCPHGIYPCKGKDRWVAIATDTEQEWRRFCQALEMPDLMKEDRFSNKQNRLENHRELDRMIAEKTVQYDRNEIVEILQKVQVAATPVMNVEDQYADVHYRERGTYVEIQHPLIGIEILYGNPFRLNKTPPRIKRYAPSLGEHNDYVLKTLIGLPDEEIKRLIDKEVIF